MCVRVCVCVCVCVCAPRVRRVCVRACAPRVLFSPDIQFTGRDIDFFMIFFKQTLRQGFVG